jgi:hypothetical protein
VTFAKYLVLCELPTLKITGEDDSILASHEVVTSSCIYQNLYYSILLILVGLLTML